MYNLPGEKFMQLSSESAPIAASDGTFRKAKIEHYFERAEELVRMARYHAALGSLNHVFILDPLNKSALDLKRTIEEAIAEVSLLPKISTNGHSRAAKRGELVVVIDQDERILSSLVKSLQKYGFTPLSAASFDEAITLLTKYKPSLIISEVNFESGPVGFDLYYWFRSNTIFSAVPFLYLATRVTREMLIAGKRMGVDEFIVKPLDEEVVMASILNCLSRQKKKVE